MHKEESVTRLDDYLSKESTILIPDIQNTNVDNRSYKFQVFPRIHGLGWEAIQLKILVWMESKDLMQKYL